MSGQVTFKVEDMSCGHCVGAITKAVAAQIPGAQVVADTSTKLVIVKGSDDPAAVKKVIEDAGYTPQAI
jgi:copper chaperone